jgi:hypothetical protein
MRRNQIAKLSEYTEFGCGWFGVSFFQGVLFTGLLLFASSRTKKALLRDPGAFVISDGFLFWRLRSFLNCLARRARIGCVAAFKSRQWRA